MVLLEFKFMNGMSTVKWEINFIASNQVWLPRKNCYLFPCQCQAENSYGDVSGQVVADFGCGCGTLGAAAALLGAE